MFILFNVVMFITIFVARTFSLEIINIIIVFLLLNWIHSVSILLAIGPEWISVMSLISLITWLVTSQILIWLHIHTAPFDILVDDSLFHNSWTHMRLTIVIIWDPWITRSWFLSWPRTWWVSRVHFRGWQHHWLRSFHNLF